MDLRMPEMEGVEAVRRIREIDPQARVVVLTTYDADEDIARALQAGAKAYILKDIAADALVACIRDVLAGKTYLAPAAAAKLAERVTQVQLTPRELAALRLMADGKSNKEIATALGISERTVKTHLAHLFEKLGVTSRTEAVRVATRRGLVRFDWNRSMRPRCFTATVHRRHNTRRPWPESCDHRLFGHWLNSAMICRIAPRRTRSCILHRSLSWTTSARLSARSCSLS